MGQPVPSPGYSGRRPVLRGGASSRRAGQDGAVTFLSQLRDVPARLRKESRQVPTDDIDESEVEVDSTAHAAAGVTAVAVAMQRAVGQMGPVRTASTLLRAQPGRRLRLPGLRLARPGARAPAHGGVLRERREGGRRGGDARRRSTASSSPRTPSRSSRGRTRLLARPAGPDHRADGAARGRDPLRADQLGRRVRPDRRPPQRGSTTPDEAVFYTSGKTSNEAAFAYQLFVRCLRHQQPPRLLEHVPRVDAARRSPRRSASARARSASRTSTRPS